MLDGNQCGVVHIGVGERDVPRERVEDDGIARVLPFGGIDLATQCIHSDAQFLVFLAEDLHSPLFVWQDETGGIVDGYLTADFVTVGAYDILYGVLAGVERNESEREQGVNR